MAVASEQREGCEGCGRYVLIEELTTVTMPDGERMACCQACEPHARAAARKVTALDQRRDTCDGCNGTFHTDELVDVCLADGTVIACCQSCNRETPTAEETDCDPKATADVSENLCTQCNEWVTEELFEITTIDGRSESMCSPCKDLAEEKGVISDVKMRKSRAREILGVEPETDAEALRDAYHTQIKHAHPDRKGGSRSAFKLVKAAYERLL